MGCLGTRANQNEIKQQKISNVIILLDCLSQGQFNETIIVNSSIYNYSYIKERKAWIIRKKTIINSLDQLINSKNNWMSQNYFTSFLDFQTSPYILLRPIRNTKPNKPPTVFMTALAKNDMLPQQLMIKFVDSKTSQLLNFSNNGKYSFFLQIKLYNLSSLKQCYRFQQILSIKISQILKFVPYEFYGLIDFKKTDKMTDLIKFINKNGGNLKFIDLNKQQQESSTYFNGHEVFNCLDEDGSRLVDQDTFFVIDPTGKVIRAEAPEFYVSKKQDQQAQCDEFDDLSSQKSKSLNYEKKLLKELHLHYANFISKNRGVSTVPLPRKSSTQQQLTKYIIAQQQIFQSLEQISGTQYKDFKMLFKSYRLHQILNKYHPGEPFQFELIKQEYFNYDFDEGNFKFVNRLHLLPAIYPTASIQKQKILLEICRELKESIGLRWKDPDMNIYSIPHMFTFNKFDLMEFLQSFSKKFDFKLKFCLIKSREIRWEQKQLIDEKILKQPKSHDLSTSIGPQPKSEWITELNPQFIFKNNYELENQPLKIDQEQITQIKLQNEQNLSEFKQMKHQNIDEISLCLIKKFLTKGINYSIEVHDDDWMTQTYGQMQKNQDSEWKKIKSDCLQFNQLIERQEDSLIEQFCLENKEQMSIKTVKCQFWDDHNYSFIEYVNKASFTHSLTQKQYDFLKTYLPSFMN